MKRNYKDDFDFLLKLYSCLVDSEGNVVEESRQELGWPEYDWEAKLYTSVKPNAYVASCIGGVCTNCYNDNGKIHIVVNNHHMGTGRVKVDFRAELPREIYPDNYQRNLIPEPLDIELVTGRGDLPDKMEAELLMPYIKGKAFTYDDLTQEQIDELAQAITDKVWAEEITEEEVMELVASLGGDALTGEPLRAATDGEIDAMFNRIYTSEEETDYGDGE